MASTGVIAEPLDVGLIKSALPRLAARLAEPDTAVWQAAATAIGTTDTFPKGSAARVEGTEAHVAGFAKGSGMIAPDMATMLAFIFTDLAVDALDGPRSCLEASTRSKLQSHHRRLRHIHQRHGDAVRHRC